MSIASLCRAVRSLGISAAQVVKNVRAFEKALREMPEIEPPVVHHYRCACCGCPVQRAQRVDVMLVVECPCCGGLCGEVK